MAHKQNKQGSQLEAIGHKVRTVAEIAGTMKGAWELGSAMYSGIRAAAPIVGPILASML